MPELPQEGEITTSHEAGREAEAAKLVALAWAKIEVGYPNDPKVHAKRVARMQRLSRLGDHGVLVNIVAQWLSAEAWAARMPKAEAKGKPSWQEKARKATERIATLADEVEELRQHLARLSEALRYEGTTDDGHELSGNVQVVAGCLADALPSLRFAFPRPVYISRRRFWRESEIDAFEARQAASGVPAPAGSTVSTAAA